MLLATFACWGKYAAAPVTTQVQIRALVRRADRAHQRPAFFQRRGPGTVPQKERECKRQSGKSEEKLQSQNSRLLQNVPPPQLFRIQLNGFTLHAQCSNLW
uniref:Uncharacterized protein n=1 Tax=Eutreptiella gymnastica TaxID=73025 RepID=A0A7S4CA46_9EUGL